MMYNILCLPVVNFLVWDFDQATRKIAQDKQ